MDQLHLEDQGTGNMPNPSGIWWWWYRKLCISLLCAVWFYHNARCKII